MHDGLLRFEMSDPRANRRRRHSLSADLTEGAIYEDYYARFIRQYAREGTRIAEVNGDRFRVRDLGELDVTIGIDESILTRAPGSEITRVPQRETDHEFVGRDGIYVSLGQNWSEENMKKPPTERN
jgi:hypothetical protein